MGEGRRAVDLRLRPLQHPVVHGQRKRRDGLRALRLGRRSRLARELLLDGETGRRLVPASRLLARHGGARLVHRQEDLLRALRHVPDAGAGRGVPREGVRLHRQAAVAELRLRDGLPLRVEAARARDAGRAHRLRDDAARQGVPGLEPPAGRRGLLVLRIPRGPDAPARQPPHQRPYERHDRRHRDGPLAQLVEHARPGGVQASQERRVCPGAGAGHRILRAELPDGAPLDRVRTAQRAARGRRLRPQGAPPTSASRCSAAGSGCGSVRADTSRTPAIPTGRRRTPQPSAGRSGSSPAWRSF